MIAFTYLELRVIADMFNGVISEYGGLTDKEDKVYEKVLKGLGV